MWLRCGPKTVMRLKMINLDINQLVNSNGYVIHKGRKVCRSDIEFVLTILECSLGQPHCKSATAFTLGDIAGDRLWMAAMKRQEREQTGRCLSWLVDHGHVPLEKLTHRRGNTLLYRKKSIH